MNALAVVQVLVGKPQYTRNTVQIEADSGNGFVAVFTGQIIQASTTIGHRPTSVCMCKPCRFGLDQLTMRHRHTGTTNVADIVSGIASAMGCAFE